MKKIISLLVVSCLLTSNLFAATQWKQGSNTDVLEGTTKIVDIDTNTKNYAFDPLDRLLTNYREGQALIYSSSSEITATAGEIVVTDVAGTAKLMLQNAASTQITWANIDTGTEAISTTYYVYAIAASSAATAVTYKISLSATAPSGSTYYKRLGYFYNNADGDIASIVNDNDPHQMGAATAKSADVSYKALTDGFVTAVIGASSSTGKASGRTDGVSTPTTQLAYIEVASGLYGTMSFPVKKGDYWKVVSVSGGPSVSIYFTPFGN